MINYELEWQKQKRETPELWERLESERIEWENSHKNIVEKLGEIVYNLHEAEKRVNRLLKKHGLNLIGLDNEN